MADSKYRIGDFFFKAAEEPTDVDIKRTKKSRDFGFWMSPYNLIQDQGHSPTSMVMQGYLIDYLVGTTGDWGYEKLVAQVSATGEKILEVINWNDSANVRRYYGLPNDIKYKITGRRPAIFDYLFSFICPNPFAYDTTLQDTNSLGAHQATTSDTEYTLTNLTAGSFPTHPVFVLTNDSGGVVTKLEISDGAAVTSGNILTVTGSLPDDDTWVIFPVKYLTNSRVYTVYSVFEYDGVDIDITDDLYTDLLQSNANVTKVFTAGVTTGYPEVTDDDEVLRVKGTGGSGGNTGKLDVQYRACYG